MAAASLEKKRRSPAKQPQPYTRNRGYRQGCVGWSVGVRWDVGAVAKAADGGGKPGEEEKVLFRGTVSLSGCAVCGSGVCFMVDGCWLWLLFIVDGGGEGEVGCRGGRF